MTGSRLFKALYILRKIYIYIYIYIYICVREREREREEKKIVLSTLLEIERV